MRNNGGNLERVPDRPRSVLPARRSRAACMVYIRLYTQLVTSREVKKLRTAFGLSQQAFASLLGLSFVSINKWENDASAPTGLSAVLLELLKNALRRHGPQRVLEALRPVGGVPIDVVRTLTTLERS